MPPTRQINELYDAVMLPEQQVRYRKLAQRLQELTGRSDEPLFISSPGRTELGGNHTDHNHGQVLCASVQEDMVAAALPRDDNLVVLEAEGFDQRFEVDLASLEKLDSERGDSNALIRGIAAGLKNLGYTIGGFDAVVNSTVPVGSGLSSSASFEVLVGGLFDTLYNSNTISATVLAREGQRSENEYFGKPCGLMDQLACAVGGVLAIDFHNYESPDIRSVEIDFSKADYQLVVTHTGGSHADLTDAYASIPEEMKAAAGLFGEEVLGDLPEGDLTARIAKVRKELGDRSALRMLHFNIENSRVSQMCKALEQNDFEEYLRVVKASGNSSLGVLQNIIPPQSDGHEQPVALALGCSTSFFEQRGRGVCRVHGGGFAGTIQAYVHRDDFSEYCEMMETVFGEGSVHHIRVRPIGIAQVEMAEVLSE